MAGKYPQSYVAIPTTEATVVQVPSGYQQGNVQHADSLPHGFATVQVTNRAAARSAPEARNFGSQLLVPSEVLNDDDPACLRSILGVFNWLYRAGYLLMYYITLAFFIIGAPFIGCAVGALDITIHIMRGFVRPIGKLVADGLGYGTWVTTSVALMERKLAQQV